MLCYNRIPDDESEVHPPPRGGWGGGGGVAEASIDQQKVKNKNEHTLATRILSSTLITMGIEILNINFI